jgi:hypothetical protein
MMVFLNGLLVSRAEYTAANGHEIQFDNGVTLGDIVIVKEVIGRYFIPYSTPSCGCPPSTGPSGPTVASIIETEFVSGDGQTIFNVAYDEINSNLSVFVNGVLADSSNPYTANDGATIVFQDGLNNGDIVLVKELRGTPSPTYALNVIDYRSVLFEPVTAGTDTFPVQYFLDDVVEVYRNGFKLAPSNYTADNGTSVVLNTPTSAPNETVEIVVFKLEGEDGGEECNLIINSTFSINNRGALNKLDTSNDPLGEYSYDMWSVIGGTLQQKIADGKYTPNTEYTLSGDNIVTQQIMSPASGTWIVDTGTADPDNVVLNKGGIVNSCPVDLDREIERANEYYMVVPFIYKGWAEGKITQNYYLVSDINPAASIIQEVEIFGGIPVKGDGIYLDFELSDDGSHIYMFTRDYLAPSAYDTKINIIFDASL